MSGVFHEIITIPGMPDGSFLRIRTDAMGNDVHIRMGDGADEYASVWFDWDEIARLAEALNTALATPEESA